MSRRVPYETLAADPIERDATTKGSAPLKADRVRKGISPRVAFQVIEKEEEHEGGAGRGEGDRRLSRAIDLSPGEGLLLFHQRFHFSGAASRKRRLAVD